MNCPPIDGRKTTNTTLGHHPLDELNDIRQLVELYYQQIAEAWDEHCGS